MTVVTKRGKYAKYRYEAFSALASMTFELLCKNGAWKEITKNRVNAGLLTFECKGNGPQLANVNVYFKGSMVARFSLSHFQKPTFIIYEDYNAHNYSGIYLDNEQADLIYKQLREMSKVTDKEGGYIFNQYLKATQWGIRYCYLLKNSAQFEFIWGNPER